ncbi:MAG: sodium-independent anion transporter [Chloroflexi bacterium]|nr:MAG: sodium-independent anion transporter [Chloroflexota bacterium]
MRTRESYVAANRPLTEADWPEWRKWVVPWTRGYQRRWLRSDIVAGLAISAVLVPQGMAYAQLAGLPPVTGLYATILGIIGYALFGSSRQLVLGPESSTSTLIAAAIVAVAGTGAGAERGLALAGMLAVLMGVALMVGGILRLGIIASFLSKPVLVGYMNGLAITILVGQVPKMLGYPVDGDGLLTQFRHLVEGLERTNTTALAIGLACLSVILGLRAWSRRVPGVLIAVVGSTLAVSLFGLDQNDIALVGEIPKGLPRFAVPDVSRDDIFALLLPALGLGLIASADTTIDAGLFAQRNKYKLNPNQDLIGLGAANTLSGLFGGFSVSASGTRTAVIDSSGGRTQLAALTGVLVVGAVLIFATGLFRNLPQAALGAVVIAAAITLFDFRGMRAAWRFRRSEFAIASASMIGVLVLGLLEGIVIAVLLSFADVLFRAAATEVAVLGRGDFHNEWQNVARRPDVTTIPGVVVFRYEAELFFANAARFERQVLELVEGAEPPPRWLVFDAEATRDIDITAGEMLLSLVDELQAHGIALVIAKPNGRARESLRAAGLEAKIGADHIFPTVDRAVNAYTGVHPSEIRRQDVARRNLSAASADSIAGAG